MAIAIESCAPNCQLCGKCFITRELWLVHLHTQYGQRLTKTEMVLPWRAVDEVDTQPMAGSRSRSDSHSRSAGPGCSRSRSARGRGPGRSHSRIARRGEFGSPGLNNFGTTFERVKMCVDSGADEHVFPDEMISSEVTPCEINGADSSHIVS